MQLQVLSLLLVGGSRALLLCLLMIDFMFGIQLWLILMLFRLKSLCSLWCGGKCLSISLRILLPIFVTTDLLNGWLNQSIFLFCCLHWASLMLAFWNVSWCLEPDLSRGSRYMGTDSLNTYLFKDNLESLVSIEIGSCFVIEGGWFDSLWI